MAWKLPCIIGAIQEFKNIPFILLTSLAQRGDSKEAKENGFKGYLTKPIRKNDLLECIALALETASTPKISIKMILITRHTY